MAVKADDKIDEVRALFNKTSAEMLFSLTKDTVVIVCCSKSEI